VTWPSSSVPESEGEEGGDGEDGAEEGEEDESDESDAYAAIPTPTVPAMLRVTKAPVIQAVRRNPVSRSIDAPLLMLQRSFSVGPVPGLWLS
jgi:hypothetical protein